MIKNICFLLMFLETMRISIPYKFISIHKISIHYQTLASFHQTITKLYVDNQFTQLRLERILGNRGIGSRTEVTRMIQQGRVKVNGIIIRSGAKKFPINTIIEVDNQTSVEMPIIMIYHKPVGIHSTMGDPWGRINLENVVNQYPDLKLYHPVGRLDADTSGLLLFSKDGDITQTLLHPSNKVIRRYKAIVRGEVNFNELQSKLSSGVKTTLGTFTLHLIESKPISYPIDVMKFPSLRAIKEQEQENDYLKQKNHTFSSVIVECTEGKYRMVRRILHNVGHTVLTLHRIQYGNITLGSLPEGKIRTCTIEESSWVLSLLP